MKKGVLWISVLAFVAGVVLTNYFSYRIGNDNGLKMGKNRYDHLSDSVGHAIDSLQQARLVLQAEFKELQSEMSLLKARDSSMQLTIADGQRKLLLIRDQYRRLQRMDSLTSTEIEEYFRNNFGDGENP